MQFTWTELKVIFQNRFKCSSLWFSCQHDISHFSLVIALFLVFVSTSATSGRHVNGLKRDGSINLPFSGESSILSYHYCSGLGWLLPPALEVCHPTDRRLTYSFHYSRWVQGRGQASCHEASDKHLHPRSLENMTSSDVLLQGRVWESNSVFDPKFSIYRRPHRHCSSWREEGSWSV